jgi:flagellar hook-associated protein 1 FlgK
MVGLTQVLLAGLSGLRASQTGLGVVSQNIANANTPGYVRTEVALTPRSQLGAGAGVEVEGIKRAADRFLSTASYIASAANGAASARYDLLTRAQAQFGDPASGASMFAMLDNFWSALTDLSVDPASSLRRSEAVNNLETMFTEVQRIGESLQGLIAEADQRISDSVDLAQSLIDRIAAMNQEIRLNKRTGADSTGAENAQSAMIDELSALLDVRVTAVPEGGVHVRTSGGALLVGVVAARLDYTPGNAENAAFGVITLNGDLGAFSNLEPYITGGSIKGLLDVRDKELPGLAEALGGFAAALGDSVNQVHNENASSPARSVLTGRQTGLLGADSLNFTGQATIGVVDSAGVLRQRLTIDFDAGQITGEDPAAVYNFADSIDALTTALDTALGAANPAGGASFSGGVMSINAGTGGLVVQQDAADPSARAGRGFSHFFGLNDLVSRPTPLFFENGVQGADVLGFNPGGEMVFQVRDHAGRVIANRTVEITGALAAPGANWDDLVSELNAAGTGVGEYGAFALDPATGRLGFTPNGPFEVTLQYDSTQRGQTGVSVSSLHGLAPAVNARRSMETHVNSAFMDDPGLLAVGRPDLSADLGVRVVEAGDNRGAAALAGAKDSVRTFAAAGVMTAQSTTLAVYASRLGGEAGRLSSSAQRAALGAESVLVAANDRRAEVESVTLDDELMKMTVYQNAYAASARVIQAAKEMIDVLMAIGYR